MPRNMAVHNPHAGIVGGESHEQVATRRECSRVTTRGVVEVESGGGAVPGSCAAADDVVVVSKMSNMVRFRTGFMT